MSVPSAKTDRWRSLTYVGLMLGLTAGTIPLNRLAWTLTPWIHTLLESIATLFALVIGSIALVRYYSQKSIAFFLLGAGFLGAGLSDGFHAVITSPACGNCDPPSLLGLVTWSGYISD